MRLWVADFAFYLARALRSVGLALAAVAWASALASEAQQYNDLRSYAIAACAMIGVLASQWFAGLPPSARPLDLVRGMERDLLAVAREVRVSPAELATVAVERLQHGANVPKDRRSWLRGLARLADQD